MNLLILRTALCNLLSLLIVVINHLLQSVTLICDLLCESLALLQSQAVSLECGSQITETSLNGSKLLSFLRSNLTHCATLLEQLHNLSMLLLILSTALVKLLVTLVTVAYHALQAFLF